MVAYVPAIIWLISAVVCYYIEQARNIKATLLRRLIVVVLGPFAILLTLLVKPYK